MKKKAFVVAVSAVALAGMAIGSGEAIATPGVAQSPSGSVSCTVPDIYLDGPGDAPIAATCQWTKTGPDPSRVLFSWLLFPKADDGTDGPEFDGEVDFSDPATGSVVSEWPGINGFGGSAPVATFTLDGTLISGGGTQTGKFSGGTFQLHRSKSRVQKLTIKKDSRFLLPTRVSAVVTAVNSKGKAVPVDGEVVVYVKAPGSTNWVLAPAGSLNRKGQFEAAYPSFVRGTKLRVAVENCGWCTNAVAEKRIG